MGLHKLLQRCLLQSGLLVRVEVSTQVIRLDEALAAVLANVLLLLDVVLANVFLHVLRLSKPHPAETADVRLDTIVYQLVAHKIMLVLEPLVTNVALVVAYR